MMTAPAAHYLLFAEAAIEPNQGGSWRFVLENVATGENLSANDAEPIDCHERLELLAVVRGLEAIDHSARVTLVTKSRYVNRGLKRGLSDWRANDWQWERFGRVVRMMPLRITHHRARFTSMTRRSERNSERYRRIDQ